MPPGSVLHAAAGVHVLALLMLRGCSPMHRASVLHTQQAASTHTPVALASQLQNRLLLDNLTPPY